MLLFLFFKDPETHEITDFASFYYLPSSVIGNTTHSHIHAGYLFYYAVKETTESGLGPRLQALLKDMLILARNVIPSIHSFCLFIYYYYFIFLRAVVFFCGDFKTYRYSKSFFFKKFYRKSWMFLIV